MGVLDNYSAIHNYSLNLTPVKRYEESKPKPVTILSDVKEVTIAEINPLAQGKITAHHLKDYRRKSFSLMLLPDISITLDKLMEETGDINECPEFRMYDNNR